jgi:hypothetical protein
MPAICWTRYFLEAQGYSVNDNILFQDNKSAILLERNGKASSSKRTKHIAIHYFFITDRVASGNLTISWCPTADMIGDYMTKPLQGDSFRKFRDLNMGVLPITATPPNTRRTSKDISIGLVRQDGQHHRSVLGSIHGRRTVVKEKDNHRNVNRRIEPDVIKRLSADEREIP